MEQEKRKIEKAEVINPGFRWRNELVVHFPFLTTSALYRRPHFSQKHSRRSTRPADGDPTLIEPKSESGSNGKDISTTMLPSHRHLPMISCLVLYLSLSRRSSSSSRSSGLLTLSTSGIPVFILHAPSVYNMPRSDNEVNQLLSILSPTTLCCMKITLFTSSGCETNVI